MEYRPLLRALRSHVRQSYPWASHKLPTKGGGSVLEKPSILDEVGMAAPNWLFNGWTHGGMQGGYVVHPPRAIIAHFIWLFTSKDKILPYKLYGWWWSQVDHVLLGWVETHGPIPMSYPTEYAYRLALEGWEGLEAISEGSRADREDVFEDL